MMLMEGTTPGSSPNARAVTGGSAPEPRKQHSTGTMYDRDALVSSLMRQWSRFVQAARPVELETVRATGKTGPDAC